MSCDEWDTAKPIYLTICSNNRGSMVGTSCADVSGREFGVGKTDFEKRTEKM